jgi:Fe-Mn family superoxide dismutase
MEFAAGIRFLTVAAGDRDRLIFNAGGVVNHEFFFALLRAPIPQNAPTEYVTRAIEESFGTFADFQSSFKKSALALLGSGWTWLCVDPKGRKITDEGLEIPELFICSTQNHDNPAMVDVCKCFGRPILCLDMWEHAYYLQYQNRKADYIDAIWSVIDWDRVEEHCRAAAVSRF